MKFNIDEPNIQNMLGMTWNTDSDTLHFKFSKKFPENLQDWKPTKRSFMSALASIYDPLGLVGPLVVGSKVFLQNLWAQGLGWDEIIPVELQKTARKLLSEFKFITQFSFPRYIIYPDSILNVFFRCKFQGIRSSSLCS